MINKSKTADAFFKTLLWTVTLLILQAAFGGESDVGLRLYAAQAKAAGPACPLSDSAYRASVVSTEMQGQVGSPVSLHLDISPYPPASGFFYTAVVDVLEHPPGPQPEILPGVPVIRISCLIPGRYRLRVRINLIAKSSCGGAKARIISEQEIRLDIS